MSYSSCILIVSKTEWFETNIFDTNYEMKYEYEKELSRYPMKTENTFDNHYRECM